MSSGKYPGPRGTVGYTPPMSRCGILHADRIVTPTLFMCGDKDFNVPLLNSEQMYQALKSLGVDTQLVIYPNENHGISRPSYVRDRYERYLAWYDKYVKKLPEAANAAPATEK